MAQKGRGIFMVVAARAQASRRCETQVPLSGKPQFSTRSGRSRFASPCQRNYQNFTSLSGVAAKWQQNR
jgi:hypothetical protein